MANIKETLSILVALQEKDCVLDTLRQKAAEFPEAIQQRKQAFEDLRREAEEKKKGLTQLQMDKKSKEMELSTHESEIRKHNLELNSIKSNDAYKALLHEIEAGKKASSNIETDILDLMERIEQAVKASQAIDQEVKQKEKEMIVDVSRFEAEHKQMLVQVSAAEQERADDAAKVPDALMKQ